MQTSMTEGNLRNLQNKFDQERYEPTISDTDFDKLRGSIIQTQIDMLKRDGEHTKESATLQLLWNLENQRLEMNEAGFLCTYTFTFDKGNGEQQGTSSAIVDNIASPDGGGHDIATVREQLPISDAVGTRINVSQREHGSDEDERYSVVLHADDKRLTITPFGAKDIPGHGVSEFQHVTKDIDYPVTIKKTRLI